MQTFPILRLIQQFKDAVLSKFINSHNLNKNANKVFYGATKFNTNIHMEKQTHKNSQKHTQKEKLQGESSCNNL